MNIVISFWNRKYNENLKRKRMKKYRLIKPDREKKKRFPSRSIDSRKWRHDVPCLHFELWMRTNCVKRHSQLVWKSKRIFKQKRNKKITLIQTFNLCNTFCHMSFSETNFLHRVFFFIYSFQSDCTSAIQLQYVHI